MRLLFVGEGPRDRATVSEIVAKILDTPLDPKFQVWSELYSRRGYEGKLLFALLQASVEKLDGVVATIDSDDAEPGDRLSKLRSARDKYRANPLATPLPAAVGEAIPHAEAWLLDDPKAVRDVLRFARDKVIPDVLQIDPKSSLDELISDSERPDDRLVLLSEIARSISFDRCNHSSETGLREFVEDVRAELGPLAESA